MLLDLLLAATVLAPAPTGVPAATSSPAVTWSLPAAVPGRQIYSWRWTDGSKATERTFVKSRYHSVARIPKFEVRIRPAYPPWRARLLFWVNGAWMPRQQVRSNPEGRMRLSFDPIGPTGSWEDVTWIVRVRLTDISMSRSTGGAVPAQAEEILLTVHYRR